MNRYFICALLLAGMACAASASEDQLGALYRINSETEAKIQAQVLDRLLGPGKASVFLEMKAEVKTTADEESKGGVGEVHTKLPDAPAEKAAAPAGRDDDKKTAKDQRQEQSARQSKETVEKKDIFRFSVSSMKVRVLHDALLAPEKLKAVKDVLLALYPEKIKPEDIVFVPAAFEPGPAVK
jgi:hypothetical protein